MTSHLRDFKAKIACDTTDDFLIHFQERSDFCFCTFVGLIRIEYDHRVLLCTDEFSFFSFILYVHRHQNSLFNNDTAFFRRTVFQFGYRTFHQVFFFYILNLVVRSEISLVSLDLFADHFVVDIHLVIRNLVIFGQFDLDFRSQRYIKTKFEVFLSIEVDFFLFSFVRQRFAQNVQFVFTDIVVQVFRNQFVDFFDQHMLAIHFLYHTHWDHPFTETRHLCFLTEAAKALFNLVCIVSFHYFQFHNAFCSINVFKRNVHSE